MSGDSEEDWYVFEVLCKNTTMEHEDNTCIVTSLRSEIAALQFNRNLLKHDLDDMKSQMALKDKRCLDLKVEADQLREQVARQNSTLGSLRKRIYELEERERNLIITQTRNESSIEAAQKDLRYNEEKNKECEAKIGRLEYELTSNEQKRENLKMLFQDFVRRLAMALGSNLADFTHISLDLLLQKASELIQESAKLKNQVSCLKETLISMELDLKTCRENNERNLTEKENFQRQCASQIFDIDKLKQEKENVEIEYRAMERELNELKNKFASSNRNLNNATDNINQQESIICKLRDEIKVKEERIQNLLTDHQHTLQSLSLILSGSCYVDPSEASIKERIHDIINENNTKTSQLERLREQINSESQELSRQVLINDQSSLKIKLLEEEKNRLGMLLQKADSEINTYEVSRDALLRDKSAIMNFLQRLAKALNLEEFINDEEIELHTETLLLRAEQLARLESEKIGRQALVYQLQRRVRTLREQIQRKDLHLDLLRRKLSLQEDTTRIKCLLQNERDEANERIKKLVKQTDRFQLQLSEAKNQIRQLNAQLAEATDFKIISLERGRKIEDLQKRLIESEALRSKYNRKINILKDQVRTTGETIETERNISGHSLQLLRDELSKYKQTLSDSQRREAQLQNFKNSLVKILGVSILTPDYELISRLQKLVDAHHDFTFVSKRYDDPMLRLASRSPTGGSRCTRTPDRSRYDDSGYIDGVDIDV